MDTHGSFTSTFISRQNNLYLQQIIDSLVVSTYYITAFEGGATIESYSFSERLAKEHYVITYQPTNIGVFLQNLALQQDNLETFSYS